MTTIAGLGPMDLDILARAAALLDVVGRTAGTADGAAAIHCLRAVELLAKLGVPVSVNLALISGTDAIIAVGEALRHLSQLSDPAFVSPAVAQATDAAQRAYQLLG